MYDPDAIHKSSSSKRRRRYGIELNKNHSHFLLLDNGCYADKSWEGLDDFQTDVCAKLKVLMFPYMYRLFHFKQCVFQDSHKITSLTLVIGGFLEDIQVVKSRLASGQTCIILDRTGGAADTIAEAYKHHNKLKYSHVPKLDANCISKIAFLAIMETFLEMFIPASRGRLKIFLEKILKLTDKY